MKQIIDQAFVAIDHKKSVISKFSKKQDPYYYTETVKVKHKTKIFGVNAEPYYTYHEETRFNSELLNSHLAEADKSINNYLEQINNEQKILQQELLTTTSRKDQAEKTIESLKAHNVSYQAQHNQIKQNIIDLNHKLDPYRKKDAELSNGISKVTSRINSLGHIKEVTSDPVSETEHVVKSYTNQLRSFLLTQVWGEGDEDSLEMMEAIKKAGFDAHFLDNQGLGLLHFAAARSDIDLMKLVLAQDPTVIEDKTLLQYAAHNSNKEFLIKILDYNADFSFAVQFIVEQGDVAAYRTLSHLKPELTSDQSLYSCLEIAKLLTEGKTTFDNQTSPAHIFSNNQDLLSTDLFDVDAIGRELNAGFDDI